MNAFLANLDRMDDLLDNKIQASIKPEDPRAYAKLEAVLEMEISTNGIAKGLGNFLRTREAQGEERVRKDQADFQRYLQIYRSLVVSSQEAQWATEVGRLFDQSVMLAREIIALDRTKERGLGEFVRIRRELDVVLDDEIQVLTHRDLAEAKAFAQRAVVRANTVMVTLLLAGLVLGVLGGALMARSVTRPVSQLVSLTQAITKGDFSQRADIRTQDEFEILGESFNGMIIERKRAEAALQTARDQLELRVKERTEELAKYAAQVQNQNVQLHIQNLRLAQSNRELEDFAYVVSHDLKEPLRGIHNYASFLIEDYPEKLDEAGRSKLETLGRLAARMEELINSILYYSRVGRVDLAIQETDLHEVLQGVLASSRIALEERGVEVRIPRLLPTIRCDRARVGEIFQNLISNAAKYNDKPGKWVEIGWGTDRRSDSGPPFEGPEKRAQQSIVFYVKDNGIGIREKHLGVATLERRSTGRADGVVAGPFRCGKTSRN